MPYRPSQTKRLVWVLVLVAIASPASAHKVQVAGDVGGTLHLEPNDTPRAGESTLTWFALTRKGGQVISLEQCNCQLSIYSSNAAPGSPPLLTPPLKAVSVERYQNIPGTEIQFPQPGLYQLQLRGTPTAEGNFQPFEMEFEVTVATGAIAPTATPQTALPPSQPARSWRTPMIVLSAVLGLGILWIVWGRRK